MRVLLLASMALLAACGGGTPSPEAPAAPSANPAASAAPSAEPAAEAPKAAPAWPADCASKEGNLCLPPRDFAKRLCNGFFPDAAMKLFSEPQWTRAYVAVRSADAWNGLGGAASDEKLVFEEEVIVVAARAPKDLGGMQMSGNGASYDFVRWDGSCASLQQAEMSLKKIAKPKNATVPWRSLDDATKSALTADEKLAKIAADRKRECKGATMGAVSDKCEKADKALAVAVVEAIRGGVKLPVPAKLP